MKFVRNIQDLKVYTFEFFDSFLPQELSDKMVNYFLVGIGENEDFINRANSIFSSCNVDESIVADYGEVILQLNGYQDLLKKFVELILKAKKFEHLCAFLNRIFLQQIGDARYKSNRKMYSIKERYFDRFVEICMYCQIDKSLYTPFFLAIFNCDSTSKMFDYKEPLKEYLDIFLKGDDDEFISQLLSSENKNGLNEFANQSTVKTLNVLLNGYVNGEITNSSIVKKALNSHKQEGFNIIEGLLVSEEADVRYKATQLLLLINDDRRVKDRLKYIYETTQDNKTKLLLEKECNFNSLMKFETKEEFFDFVDKATPQIQERLYGARLKRYYQKYNLINQGIQGKTLTFVMETFKNREADIQVTFLKDFFRYIDKDILSKLSRVVYEVAIYRNRLLSSKWALRLIAVFGDAELLNIITSDLENWFNNNKTISTAKYLIELLAECGREELIDMLKVLLQCKLEKKQLRFIEHKVSELSNKSKQNLEDVKDKLSLDLGFDENGTRNIKVPNRTLQLKINSDCSISITNIKTGKPARISSDIIYEGIELKKYIKSLEKEVKKQKKRLYNAFLEFRNYSTKSFEECILSNPLLNYLSQKLLWARYKKDKFAQVCFLKDNALNHLAGNVISENFDDYNIALLQPLDCIELKERLKEKVGKDLLFDQLNFPVFDSEKFPPNANSVDSFNGIFCNAKLFITRLQKLKYKINNLNNKNEYSVLAKENKNLNLLTTVEFDKVILNHEDNSTTISKVRFYDLNKQTKSGKTYNLDKTEAKALSDMDSRILSNELAQIFLACKN